MDNKIAKLILNKLTSIEVDIAVLKQQNCDTQEHFNSLEKKTDTMQEHLNNLEQKTDTMQGNLNKLEQKTDTMQGNLNKLEQKTDTMQGNLNKLEQKTDTMQGNLNSIDISLSKLQHDFDDFKISTENRFTSLEKTVAKIEYEHGDKLAVLLDCASANEEQHKDFKESISNINNVLFNHSARISSLELKSK